MTKPIFTLLILSLLTSCKFSFDDNDLLTFNIYSVSDTIVFGDMGSNVDTFVISSKTIVNKGWDENTGWYNPPIANVTYKDLPNNSYGQTVIRWATADTIVQDGSLITIYKNKPHGEISEVLYFKDFIGTIDRKNQLTAERIYEKTKIYKVPSFDMTTVRDSNEITYIYWSDKSGIVAYDTKNGIKWQLIRQ